MVTVSQRNVHPFPARMAPDLALDTIGDLSDEGSIVLDPMCGSGTVPRIAAASGRRALATDVDPLAVLMTRTACKPVWSVALVDRAQALVTQAARMGESLPEWIAEDRETKDFCGYWFAEQQRYDLSRLAKLLVHMPRDGDPLRLALSRIIVTKSGGASLARDTSHSRPHRVATENDYDVFEGFVKAAKQVSGLMNTYKYSGKVSVRSSDARNLSFLPRHSVDLIVTSPPYLNAIDYLRGHRLALVWLGWTISRIRELRSNSIGSERGLWKARADLRELALAAVPDLGNLAPRHQAIVWRYAQDMKRLTRSMSRVVKPGGHAVVVVADSQLRGITVANSELILRSAEMAGFRTVDIKRRPLPQKHRYLPPPETDTGTLSARMKEELILTLKK